MALQESWPIGLPFWRPSLRSDPRPFASTQVEQQAAVHSRGAVQASQWHDQVKQRTCIGHFTDRQSGNGQHTPPNARAQLASSQKNFEPQGNDNKTGDPVFDDTRRQGLSVELAQSPFLTLIPDPQPHRRHLDKE